MNVFDIGNIACCMSSNSENNYDNIIIIMMFDQQHFQVGIGRAWRGGGGGGGCGWGLFMEIGVSKIFGFVFGRDTLSEMCWCIVDEYHGVKLTMWFNLCSFSYASYYFPDNATHN